MTHQSGGGDTACPSERRMVGGGAGRCGAAADAAAPPPQPVPGISSPASSRASAALRLRLGRDMTGTAKRRSHCHLTAAGAPCPSHACVEMYRQTRACHGIAGCEGRHRGREKTVAGPSPGLFQRGGAVRVFMDASGSHDTVATCRVGYGAGNVCLSALRTTTALTTASGPPPPLAAHGGAQSCSCCVTLHRGSRAACRVALPTVRGPCPCALF